ncbi:ABC-type glycerol-3-phosphate transport system permease component [Nitrobacteraceae bacterium AZCC 2146]
MSTANAAHSVVEPSAGTRRFAGSLVILYAVITMIPLIWIVLTSFKSPDDAISYPPKVVFSPSLEGFCNLFTTRSRQTPEFIQTLGPPQGLCDSIARSRNMVVAGPSNYVPRFVNSLIIAFGSTVLAVALGTLSAYGFSRFRVPLKDDLLFFILSTRMMPPIAVAIPIYLMYRTIGLSDTRLGMILLYTSVNVSLRRLASQGLHRRNPARVRGGSDDRWLYALSGLREGGAAAGDDRDSGNGNLLSHLCLERIRLCSASDLRQRADGAALHSNHHRRGRAGLARGRRRHDTFPGADRRVHGAFAQASAARHHLWSRSQMSLEANSMPRRGFTERILRRGPLEAIATTIIAIGVVMLMQPFFLTLYSWSFATTLFGTVMFTIVSKVRE